MYTVFTFRLENSSLEFPTSVCDPYILLARCYPTQSIVSVSTLILRRVAHNVNDNETPELVEHHKDYNDNLTPLYQAFCLCKDLSLHEQFYVDFPPSLDDQINFPKAQNRLRKPTYKTQDDFIVPDGSSQEVFATAELEQALSGIQGAEDDKNPPTEQENPWTLNLEWLAELLCSSPDDTPLARRSLAQRISMTQALDLIETEISDSSVPLAPGIVSLYVA